jgi:hypothetical protein
MIPSLLFYLLRISPFLFCFSRRSPSLQDGILDILHDLAWLWRFEFRAAARLDWVEELDESLKYGNILYYSRLR